MVRKAEAGYIFSEIILRPRLKVSCEEKRGRALQLLQKTNELCLISRAIAVPPQFESRVEVSENAIGRSQPQNPDHQG